MNFQIGPKYPQYLSGIATLALSVLAIYAGASIGRGLLSLALFVLGILSMGVGAVIVFHVLVIPAARTKQPQTRPLPSASQVAGTSRDANR